MAARKPLIVSAAGTRDEIASTDQLCAPGGLSGTAPTGSAAPGTPTASGATVVSGSTNFRGGATVAIGGQTVVVTFNPALPAAPVAVMLSLAAAGTMPGWSATATALTIKFSGALTVAATVYWLVVL